MGGSNFVTIGAIPDAGSDGVQGAAINFNTLTGTVVAAVPGKRIFVHGMFMDAAGAATVTINDLGANATVAQTGPLSMITGTPFVLPWQNYPWATVQAGNALVFVGTGATVQVSGRILYVQG
jgi:hypothetical protein